MKKIRILFLATYPHADNPLKGIFNKRAVDGLKQYGEIDVVSIRMWKPGRKFVEKITDGNTNIYHLCIPHYPSNKPLIHRISTYLVFFFIRQVFKKKMKKYDIIHSASASSYGIYASYLKKISGVKHVMQLTGSDINSEIPLLSSISYVKKIPQLVDAVVGNSIKLVEEFNSFFNTSFEKLKVYRGVDLNEFYYSENNTDFKDGITFLFLGGLDNYADLPSKINTKGGITLMEAWESIESKLKKYNAKLLFGGPQSNRVEFFDWQNKLKYPEQIKLLGPLNKEEVKEAYYKSNVVIIPSMEEGLPNVAVESSACGRPAIGSDTGGIPEIISDQKSGFIFPSGNKDLLSDLLLKCSKGEIDLSVMGAHARKKVEEKFDKKNFTSSYFEIYNKI